MFFYRKVTASGHTLQLLAACRPPGGGAPTHRVVVSLGDAPLAPDWFGPLAKLLELRLAGQPALATWGLPAAALIWVDRILLQLERQGGWPRRGPAGPPAQLAAAAGAPTPDTVADGVLLDEIEHRHSTVLGPLWCGLHAWEQLGLPAVLTELGFTAAQRQAAAALVLSRLAVPASEHALVAWLPQSSLPDLVGPTVLRGGVDRLYRAGDKLLRHRDRLEAHLRERTQGHCGVQRTLFLYDLTNFHFEGVCAGNPQARRGKNKQRRDDCPQVVVGMVFDESGFALLHRTFAGNTADCRTLPAMALALRAATDAAALNPAVAPTVVVDGGLATTANLAALRGHGFHYLVNDRRVQRGAWRAQFAAPGFAPLPGRPAATQVEVRALDLPAAAAGTPPERLVLCKSAGRREKELAIRSRAEQRLRDELTRLGERVGTGRWRHVAAVERALGRVLGRHPRAARFYQATVTTAADGTAQLQWQRHDEPSQAASDLAGCYVLRSDRTDLSAAELWQLYMTLERAEAGFQALKSDLGLRPAFHQRAARVDAHVFVTVLAYQVLRFLLHTLETHGDYRCWRTLRTILSTHCYATLEVPTRGGRRYLLRRPGQPEACQWAIYRQLGLHSLRSLPRSKTVLPPPATPAETGANV